MQHWWTRVVPGITLMLLAAGCAGGDDDGTSPTLAPLPTLTPTTTATATAVPSAFSEDEGCATRTDANASLAASVEAVMEGYAGTWGFALYDLECELVVTANPDYQQYPASASKIITVVAALRAVEYGWLTLEEIEPLVDQVMTHSSDVDADALETYLTPEDLSAVLTDAGVSEGAYIRETWHYTYMTPSDMARIWAGIVRGTLLNEAHTALLLEKASMAQVPPEYETWPSPPVLLDGFGYGQKAGYWVSDGLPYHFVGAGFLRDVADPKRSFIPVVFIRSDNPDLMDQQRRLIWPLVVEHVAAVRGIAVPTPVAAAP